MHRVSAFVGRGGGGNSLSLSSHQTALYSVVGQENYNNEELHLPAMDCIIILGSVAPLILDELLGLISVLSGIPVLIIFNKIIL